MKQPTLLFVLTHALLAVAIASAQEATLDEAARMRAASLKQLAVEAPLAVSTYRTLNWQSLAPKSFRRSLRPPLVAEYKFTPRTIGVETGTVLRFSPATETLALGLSNDPPRPAYPQLAAEARSVGLAISIHEHLLLPPFSRTSEAKVSLVNDPASITLKPHTAPIVKVTRGPIPIREERTADPFSARQEVQLRTIPPDTDPPPPNLELPSRPKLP